MFDIGFWELVVIGVVALLVIGPERLPAVARTAGIWVGRARRFVNSVQSDIKREMNKSEELQNLLEEQSQIKEMHEIIEQTVDDVRKTVPIDRENKIETGMPAHEPRSLENDTADSANDSTEQVTKTVHSDAQEPASTTDAMNDSAK